MNWTLPGTTLSAAREEADNVSALFGSMFLPGGMVLSQVASITGLEPYTIQNWVKRGFLSKPERKRYSVDQLCRIITINMLKDVLPLDKICGLLTYINGQLDDKCDDIISDARLYFLFVRLAARVRKLNDPAELDRIIAQFLLSYEEPTPGAKQRVEKALRIMLTAWISARMYQEAEKMLQQL